MEKLASEDALKAEAEQMKSTLVKEWQTRLQETVKSARAEEQLKSDERIGKIRAEFDNKIDLLEQ